MKSSPVSPVRILALLAAGLALAVAPLSAYESQAKPATHAATGELVPTGDKTDAAWLAKARADYPLNSCSVSGEKFEDGDKEMPLEYIYQQAGKPDRLIRFCCKDCVEEFRKDPAKFLHVIDDAAAAKASGAKK